MASTCILLARPGLRIDEALSRRDEHMPLRLADRAALDAPRAMARLLDSRREAGAAGQAPCHAEP